MKKFIFIIIFCAISFILVYFLSAQKKEAAIAFFDVGQGDSFALRADEGSVILVDGGPDLSVLAPLGSWLGFSGNVDYIVLSHGHDDHISALPEVAKRHHIKAAFLPSGLSGADAEALFSALKEDKAEIFFLKSKRCLFFSASCRLCLFPPEGKMAEDKNENNRSLALHFFCSGLSLVAAGDAEKKRELDLLKNDFDWRAEILKISHHGSGSSSAEEFLRAVSPQQAVISVGKDNSYNHPQLEVLERLQKLGLKIWRTDKDGSFEFYFKNSQINYRKLGY